MQQACAEHGAKVRILTGRMTRAEKAAQLDNAESLAAAIQAQRYAAELAALARAAGAVRDVLRTVAVVEAGLERAGVAGPASGGRRTTTYVQLTDREAEVAHLAADGRSDKEIAALLTVSIRTVQSHLAAAYRKLGVSSRTELGPLLPGPLDRG